MADISYIQKEDLDDSGEAMEIDEVDDDGVDYNPSPGASGTCNIGGSGDEGGRDELLLKLQHYTSSHTNFSRQRIGKILVEIFRTASNNGMEIDVNDIMLWVQQIAEDHDTQIRLDLIEQLPHVATLCEQSPHLFGDVFQDQLPGIVIKYLQDSDNQVRMTAQETVLSLTEKGFIDDTTIEVKLFPVIETLCRSSDFINSGISIFKYHRFDCSSHQSGCDVLMSKMAPLIGKELTEKIFLDRYIALCENEDFYVRKLCVTHFGEFCTAVGKKALFRKLIPIFVDLCCDEVWGIRKACVDVMVPVSCCMSLQYRRLLFADLLATHLNDDSKWVRMSAFQILGPFISTFAKQFTEVTYNQHGELVFTSQQDNRFSVRYSYDGIFPTKCAVWSHTLDAEAHNSNDSFNSSVILRKPICEEDDDEGESQEDQISTMRAYKSRIQRNHWKKKKNNERTEDDTENYSSFLYYYIAPDLPLDEELVEAAKKSTAENPNPMLPNNVTTITDPLKEDRYLNDEYEITDFNGQDIVPQHLIDSFLSMAEPAQFTDMGADIPHHCAFSFPAVMLTLGKEHWPYLRQAYQLLACANQWKVRRTLASSIHEIAIILGEELAAADLVRIYNGFIKDLDEVRIGALKHLATFLKILKPVDRRQYLPILKEFLTTDNESNWRFREELATQLLEVVNLFCATEVKHHIVPLSLQLLRDKVAAVRHVALSLVTQIVAHLSDNERLVTSLFLQLRYSLIIHGIGQWTRRQMYAVMCAKLISSNAISGDRFSNEMLPNLLKLSSDKVPNVRLAVARTLLRNVVPMGQEWLGMEHAEEVEKGLAEMRSDPDRDVRVSAGGEENPVVDILQTKTEQSQNILF